MTAMITNSSAAIPELEWYVNMVRIRLFEQKVHELFTTGVIRGPIHLTEGQEAVSVGVIAAMEPDDVLTNTYRGHGEALARGVPPQTAFAELMGREDGSSGGVGGSMHMTDFSLGNIGANAIVGANIPIAVGAAMSFRIRAEPRICVAFFGDGATNIGAFHESLNMASVWRAPVVFVIVNNLYGEYSPIHVTTAGTDLARRADPFGIPGKIVDGQDVGAVKDATHDAADRARRGDGPTLLEMKTYRYRGHSRTDPAKYRPASEVQAWKARDPIATLGGRLVEDGVLTSEKQSHLDQEIQEEVDAAAERAGASPPTALASIAPYVYAD